MNKPALFSLKYRYGVIPVKDKTYDSRVADKFVVRLPEGMRGDLSELARERHISMNSYIVQKLETAVAIDKGFELPSTSPISEKWTPVKGMLVQFKDVERAIPWEIIGFDFDSGSLMVELRDLIEGIPIKTALDRVKPFLV